MTVLSQKRPALCVCNVSVIKIGKFKVTVICKDYPGYRVCEKDLALFHCAGPVRSKLKMKRVIAKK